MPKIPKRPVTYYQKDDVMDQLIDSFTQSTNYQIDFTDQLLAKYKEAIEILEQKQKANINNALIDLFNSEYIKINGCDVWIRLRTVPTEEQLCEINAIILKISQNPQMTSHFKINGENPFAEGKTTFLKTPSS